MAGLKSNNYVLSVPKDYHKPLPEALNHQNLSLQASDLGHNLGKIF